VFLNVFSVSHAGLLAKNKFGVRGGYYFGNTDSWFLGVDSKFNILRINANPNIEFLFIDGARAATLNLDGFFNFSGIPIAASIWAGAGIGLAYVDPDGGSSAWDPTLNIIAGIEFPHIPLSPYGMVKYIITDKVDGFVLTAGIRF
jgi:hypothetical protein